MSCNNQRWVRATGIAVGVLCGVASTSSAQLPGLPGSAPVPYHAPQLILAQPGDGGVVPADKPIAVFRFVQGETTDPIDALSFTVIVDGVDRTNRFQLSNNEAWGAVDDPSVTTTGSHEVRARICSSRGTCTTVRGTVNVTSADPVLALTTHVGSTASKASVKVRAQSAIQVLGKVLDAARVLSHP